MKSAIRKLKAILIAAALCSTIFLTSSPTVHAQDDSFDLEQEISETNVMAMARYTIANSYNWNADIPAKTTARGSNIYSFVEGDTIIINISQDPSGTGYASYVGLYDRDNSTYGFPENGATTTGWTGGIFVVGYSGHFSLAIKNASNHTIHYEGTYSF